MKKVFNIVKWFTLFLIGCVLLLVGALCSFDVEIPRTVLDEACDRLSTDDFALCVDRVTLRVPRRVRVEGFRVLDRSKAEAAPFASARRVTARFRFNRWPVKWRNVLSSVEIDEPRFPRLGDDYYAPVTNLAELAAKPRPTDEGKLELPFTMPTVSSFRVKMTRPEILGIVASRIEVANASCTSNRVEVKGVKIFWPDADVRMTTEGEVTLDLDEQRLVALVHGQARQRNIRPMLHDALDVKSAFPWYDGFTGVETPVDASCPITVDFRKRELKVDVLLHPTGGAYNGVPVRKADGGVFVHVFGFGEPFDVRATVGPIEGELMDGGKVSGKVWYECFGNKPAVHFDNVEMTTSLSNALAIADVFTDGTLDCLQPETPATIRLEGVLAAHDTPVSTNRVDGTIAFERGSFFGVPLRFANVGFAIRGTRVMFDGARAAMPRGGKLTGDGWVDSPDGVAETAVFGVDLAADGIAFADVSDVFDLHFGGTNGVVSGNLAFSGGLGTNALETLNGRGKIKIEDGQLAQIPFFAGLTALLAEKVPGVGTVVNQSAGEIAFSITNGVLTAEAFSLEGAVFSIRGAGTLDLDSGKIDMLMRVQFFRKDSFLGKLATPITWPFAKLLMQFRVGGTLDEPTWRYASAAEELNVIDSGKQLIEKINPFASGKDGAKPDGNTENGGKSGDNSNSK